MFCVPSSISGRGLRRLQIGFSLIELMVGIVIGLFTVLAVTQAFTIWGVQHRTVSSKTDAQTTVTLAAFVMDQDLKQAGQGFSSARSSDASSSLDSIAGCPVTGLATTVSPAATTTISFAMLGLQITDGGATGAPDQIVTAYGNSAYRVLPEKIIAGSATVKKVKNPSGINAGDVIVLAADRAGSSCQLAEVTSTDSAVLLSDKAFAHLDSGYQSFYNPAGTTSTPVFNPSNGSGTTAYWSVYDLGPAPQVNQWSIAGSTVNPSLLRTSVMPINGSFPPPREVAEGIVNLQAQYGYDLDGDGQISSTEWFDSDANKKPNIGGATVNWKNVLAIRYAILARSRNYEAAPFSADNPGWAAGAFVMTDVGGTSDSSPTGPANWRNYRYSVYQSVIPIRNVLWGNYQ
jgi:type IV pilus assembly protein PilW